MLQHLDLNLVYHSIFRDIWPTPSRVSDENKY